MVWRLGSFLRREERCGFIEGSLRQLPERISEVKEVWGRRDWNRAGLSAGRSPVFDRSSNVGLTFDWNILVTLSLGTENYRQVIKISLRQLFYKPTCFELFTY